MYVRSAIRFLWYVLIKVLLCALQCKVVHILFIFLVTYNAPDFDVFNMSVLYISKQAKKSKQHNVVLLELSVDCMFVSIGQNSRLRGSSQKGNIFGYTCTLLGKTKHGLLKNRPELETK